MIANIEALATLSELGTMTRAATRLRVTQSAVSKRIAALESHLGQKLVEPAGRGVRLTSYGVRLLDKTGPFMASLKEALLEEPSPQGSRLVIGISESILSSWGPRVLSGVKSTIPRLELVANAHRSPVAIDHVRSGEYMLALCAGQGDNTPDLTWNTLFQEPMVIVPSGLEPFQFRRRRSLSVFTIEPHSSTWGYLDRRIKLYADRWGTRIEVEQTLQSFSCIVQMARYGFGHGLVPLGLALALGIRRETLIELPDPGLFRPISLVGRSSTFARPLVKSFHQQLTTGLSDILPDIT